MANRKYIRSNKTTKPKAQVRKYKKPNRVKVGRTQLPENFKLPEYIELPDGSRIDLPKQPKSINDLPLGSKDLNTRGGPMGGNDLFNLSCQENIINYLLI